MVDYGATICATPCWPPAVTRDNQRPATRRSCVHPAATHGAASCNTCASSATPAAGRLATSPRAAAHRPRNYVRPAHFLPARPNAASTLPLRAPCAASVALPWAASAQVARLMCASDGAPPHTAAARRLFPDFRFSDHKFKTLDTIRHNRMIRSEKTGSDTTVGIRITPSGEAAEEQKINSRETINMSNTKTIYDIYMVFKTLPCWQLVPGSDRFRKENGTSR
ncbi:hypothetical protein F511_33680 [Dorcoceras hygrometricum]|uniref:Uncharacterized protein n=1 Tax=Dorcoceras hygrometricum TaxID=472368 RepID=A0A2Z7A3F9_9LAMI|nr:hypothetical protein F511_33680 [Dorcoceras hygrometricum]